MARWQEVRTSPGTNQQLEWVQQWPEATVSSPALCPWPPAHLSGCPGHWKLKLHGSVLHPGEPRWLCLVGPAEAVAWHHRPHCPGGGLSSSAPSLSLPPPRLHFWIPPDHPEPSLPLERPSGSAELSFPPSRAFLPGTPKKAPLKCGGSQEQRSLCWSQREACVPWG